MHILGAIVILLEGCAAVWLWMRMLMFLNEHDLLHRRGAGKTEIQTLFHGNTKDEDQL